MEFQTLQDATYFIIHETEGFKQNVYYDGKGIPTFGLGVAFIGYNSKNNSFSAISRIGNTPIDVRTVNAYAATRGTTPLPQALTLSTRSASPSAIR